MYKQPHIDLVNEQDAEGLRPVDAWDQFLQSSRPDVGFMQTSWWANIKAASGWNHFDVIIKDIQGILGGARVYTRSFTPGACYYYVPDGPVLPAGKAAAEQVFQEIIAEIDEKRKQDPDVVSHLRLETRWAHRPGFVRGCREARSWREPRNTLYMDLRLSESALLAQMKPKGRYNIGVARRHGVSVVEDLSPEGLADFWAIDDETVIRHGLDGMSARYYREMMKTLIAVDGVSIFFAKYQGAILAGALVIYFGDRATYYIGGSRLSHRRVMAPYLLHFEAMLKAKARGHRWYDFYGIAPQDKPNDPWANFSAFKRKFGGCEMNFVPALDFIYDPDAYQNYRRKKS
jgi:lipid II:glycine glycyltransferase (peptidoglycan interpeptide bridge formation enzyme)